MTSTTTTGTWVRVTDGEAALWRHQQRRPLSATYNIYAAVEIEGRVNVTVLRSAVEAVLTDHFRLTATIADDERGLAWRRRGLCWRAAAIGALDESGAVAAEARRPFLPDEPLHRIVYWDAGLAGGLLQLTVHHVACDGLRLHLLVGQIVAVYRRLVDGAEEPVGSPALPYEPLVTASEADRFWRPRRALADQTFALAPARVPTCAPEVGERLVRVTETSVADCASRAAEVHAAGVGPFAVVAAGGGRSGSVERRADFRRANSLQSSTPRGGSGRQLSRAIAACARGGGAGRHGG